MAAFSRDPACRFCPPLSDCGTHEGQLYCFWRVPLAHYKPTWMSTLLPYALLTGLSIIIIFNVFMALKYPNGIVSKFWKKAWNGVKGCWKKEKGTKNRVADANLIDMECGDNNNNNNNKSSCINGAQCSSTQVDGSVLGSITQKKNDDEQGLATRTPVKDETQGLVNRAEKNGDEDDDQGLTTTAAPMDK